MALETIYVMTFLAYYLQKQLEPVSSKTIVESSFVKNIEKNNSHKIINKFYDSLPHAQYDDVEDAFKDAVEIAKKAKPGSEQIAKNLINKEMQKNLSVLKNKKRHIRKNLSCIKSIKKSITSDSLEELVKRSAKILTNLERRVLRMCSEGMTVRRMGQELEISYASAWRALNSGIDKLRLSYGMKPRGLGL